MQTIKDLKFDQNNYRQISGFGGYYYISREGNVLSTRQNQPRILKQYTNNSGYKVVFIMYRQRQSVLLVHRLVALAYIENPQNKNVVNHKDFLDVEPGYLIGMSVPPVMTAQIAYQVYLQWFRNQD